LNSNRNESSLMAPQAKGGATAEGGFRFQDYLLLARVPYWLTFDGFTAMSREMFGDAEASIFDPGFGLIRELVEYKNHELSPSEFREEVKRFKDLYEGNPGAYRRFILACRGLSKSLRPFGNSLQRVRGALPFYEGVQTINEASYKEYENQAINAAKLDKNEAKFVFNFVDIQHNCPDAESLRDAVFFDSLTKNLPAFCDARQSDLETVRKELASLLEQKKAESIKRTEIERVLFNCLSEEEQPQNTSVKIHTGISLIGDDKPPLGSIIFQWNKFFAGEKRQFPAPEEWNEELMAQIRYTKQWFIDNERPRRIHLSGNRRLSISLALGSIFSAVAGFSVAIDYRGDNWSTDKHPNSDTPYYNWDRKFSAGSSDILVVGIGILKDIAGEVDTYLSKVGGDAFAKLFLKGKPALKSPEQVNLAAQEAKKHILDAVRTSGASRIHLFLAGPSHFALFLGHYLNTAPPILCHERVEVNSYTPSCTIWGRE